MNRFKIGQEVVCINGDGWTPHSTFAQLIDRFFDYQIDSNGPHFREICTVTGYSEPHYVQLEGYGKEGYLDSEFQPVQSIEELEEILEHDSIHHP